MGDGETRLARAVVPGAEGSLRLRHAAHTKQYRPAAQHPCTLSCDVCLIRLAPVSRPTAHIVSRYSTVDIGHHHFKILLHGDTLAIKHPAGPRMMRRGGLPRMTRLFCSINKSLTGVVSRSAVTGSNSPGAGEVRFLVSENASPRLGPLSPKSLRGQLDRLWPGKCVGAGFGIASVARGLKVLRRGGVGIAFCPARGERCKGMICFLPKLRASSARSDAPSTRSRGSARDAVSRGGLIRPRR